MNDHAHLLSDEEVLTFISQGYMLLQPDYPEGFNERVHAKLKGVKVNLGNGILQSVPELNDVFAHPVVHGALVSLLGPDMEMNPHRHCHTNMPGSISQGWHQDGTNVRHHQIRMLLAMYYPHDVPPEMGPTVILPGSHFRNAPTDRMASYANIRGQQVLTVKAGAVALVHYDMWHAGTANRTSDVRYMLKFLFDRKSEPAGPSWAHDPALAAVAKRAHVHDMVGPNPHYNSDLYKEWTLRDEMWKWMLGQDTAHKDNLIPGIS